MSMTPANAREYAAPGADGSDRTIPYRGAGRSWGTDGATANPVPGAACCIPAALEGPETSEGACAWAAASTGSGAGSGAINVAGADPGGGGPAAVPGGEFPPIDCWGAWAGGTPGLVEVVATEF